MKRNEAGREADREPVGIPFAFLFPLAAVQGGLYVACLPIVSIATAVSLAMRRILGGIALHASRSICFGWRPTEAYLAGKVRRKRRG